MVGLNYGGKIQSCAILQVICMYKINVEMKNEEISAAGIWSFVELVFVSPFDVSKVQVITTYLILGILFYKYFRKDISNFRTNLVEYVQIKIEIIEPSY